MIPMNVPYNCNTDSISKLYRKYFKSFESESKGRYNEPLQPATKQTSVKVILADENN